MINKKNILKYLVCALTIFLNENVCAQYTMITDPIFEQVLIEQNIDSDQLINGQVLTADISDETILLIEKDNIMSYVGLQDFTNLTTLTSTGYSEAPFINLDQNLLLEELTLQGQSSITTLNLTNNVNLKYIDLACSSLVNINIDSCVALEVLYLSFCSINNLNIDSNINLQTIGLSLLNITSLNLNNNIALKKISLINLLYFPLDFSNNINLEELILARLGDWSSTYGLLNLSNNVHLKRLYIEIVNLNNINIQNCLDLEYLLINYTSLSSINLLNNTSLNYVGVSLNNLSSLDTSTLQNLTFFACQSNNINSLNLNNNANLAVLYCGNNNLQNLSIQNGNNNLLNGVVSGQGGSNVRFDCTNNPNLTCIFVDDVTNCEANWLGKGSNSTYVSTQSECNALLSKENFVLTNNTKIYPNPTTKTINIDFGQNLASANLVVSDVLGQVVSSKTINNLDKTTLEINESSGIYFLEITNDKLEKQVFKIVKE